MKPDRHTVQIILVQSHDRDNGKVRFRIQKLIGAVSVETSGRVGNIANKKLHVGDHFDEQIANDLSDCRHYEVTVTEKLER